MKKILLLFVIVISFSCSEENEIDNIGLDFDRELFESKKNMWKESKIFNYKISQEFISPATRTPVKITSIVKDNILESISVIDNSSVPFEDELISFKTIDELFRHIEWYAEYFNERINSSEDLMVGCRIIIEYDEIFHFPTKVEFEQTFSELLFRNPDPKYYLSEFVKL